MSADLADLRADVVWTDGPVWFQHGGGSPWPRCARAAVERAARAMSENGMTWPEQYAEDRASLRAVIARLVGGSADTVVLVRSTGHGLSLVARGLDWQAGDNVIGAKWEFPTNLVPWQALGRQGVEFRLAEPVEGRITPEGLLALADDRTRVIAVSLVQFWNGYRVDVAALGAECRRRGILLVVDGIQGIGAVRLDSVAAQVALHACGGVKWLLGPAGLGFAQLDPALIDRLEPITLGMGSLADPWASVLDPDFTYAAGARRFEESATGWFEIAALLASITLLESVGFDVIERRVLELTSYLGEELAAKGHELVAPWPRTPAESSGILGVRTPGVPADEQLQRLEKAGIIARVHGDFLRLSPHAYNTDEEADRALAALATPVTGRP